MNFSSIRLLVIWIFLHIIFTWHGHMHSNLICPHLQHASSSNIVSSNFPESWWLPLHPTFLSVFCLWFLPHSRLFLCSTLICVNRLCRNVCFSLDAHLCVCLGLSWSGPVEKGSPVMKGVLIGRPGAWRIDLAEGWFFKAFLLAHWVNLLIIINNS